MSLYILISGVLSFDDFLGLMTVKMAEKDSKEEILKAFRLFDDDETGKISFKNLKRVAKELGENLTNEELQVFLHKYLYMWSPVSLICMQVLSHTHTRACERARTHVCVRVC